MSEYRIGTNPPHRNSPPSPSETSSPSSDTTKRSPQIPASEIPAEEPKFGLIDVIEAFTAMRHEFRTQSSEGRELAERLTGAVEQIQHLESSIQQTVSRLHREPTTVNSNSSTNPNPSADELNLRRLCETLAEIDFHLTRTVQIAIDSLAEDISAQQEQQRLLQHFAEQIETQVQRTGRVRRWLLGSWPKHLQASLEPPIQPASTAASAAVDALRMLHDRVTRLRSEAGIERLDVTGKPFDGTLMNAVESVPSNEVPKGHVVTQLCPAYQWRNSILRYAEVNVSQGTS